jgi:hypothetical protein
MGPYWVNIRIGDYLSVCMAIAKGLPTSRVKAEKDLLNLSDMASIFIIVI